MGVSCATWSGWGTSACRGLVVRFIKQGLLCWIFKGGFKVNSSTVSWYRSSYGTDFDIPEISGPVKLGQSWGLWLRLFQNWHKGILEFLAKRLCCRVADVVVVGSHGVAGVCGPFCGLD